jgi:anaerobic selenocysteine-containing dehydrogenase
VADAYAKSSATIVSYGMGVTQHLRGTSNVQQIANLLLLRGNFGKLPPASIHLRSEPAIVAAMAQATLPRSTVPWADMIADYDRIRTGIEAVFPDFLDFNNRIRTPGGFRLPLPATERIWRTESGKAQFIPFGTLAGHGAGNRDTLTLTTIRSHDQYNTTIYDLGDRYRGVFGRRDIIFMNEQDLADRGLEHGDVVDIQTDLGVEPAPRLDGFTAVVYEIARGSVAAYYPEANCLVPLDYFDPLSGTPSYKSIPVRIARSVCGDGGHERDDLPRLNDRQ